MHESPAVDAVDAVVKSQRTQLGEIYFGMGTVTSLMGSTFMPAG